MLRALLVGEGEGVDMNFINGCLLLLCLGVLYTIESYMEDIHHLLCYVEGRGETAKWCCFPDGGEKWCLEEEGK